MDTARSPPMAFGVSVVLAALELALLPAITEHRPVLWVSTRTGTGPDGALAGKAGRLYRLQPEVVIGFRARDRVEVYAGAGVGPVYLVRSSGGGVVPSASGVLGLRLLTGGDHAVSVLARAEAVGGGGAAVSFDLRLSFDP
jgi:hypothetical protein